MNGFYDCSYVVCAKPLPPRCTFHPSDSRTLSAKKTGQNTLDWPYAQCSVMDARERERTPLEGSQRRAYALSVSWDYQYI